MDSSDKLSRGLLSRKFLLALVVVVLATLLVWFKHIADGVYSAIVIVSVTGYLAANVTQKATSSDVE